MPENVSERVGFLFEGSLDEIDPTTSRMTAFEEARQISKLIMIASESAAPPAVREAMASVFTDLYAEGYPAAHMSREPESLLGDVAYQSAYHERYGDRRYYKGTEFADVVEALAQERVRALFAPNRYPGNNSSVGPDQIQANVQPLSGANANTAVYLGLLQAGDTIMGLNLAHGGHLSHGSPVNISGKLFKVVSYGVDPSTGRIDYDEAERLALEHNPKLIVCGASAYPWHIDFARLRRICDALPRKAYLLADISHPSGLTAAGLFPNPVGIADVTTFTTHKTLIGPRAAIILTTNEALARRIDRAVFPGLQGGPHMNTIAALAVAFKIALNPEFNNLQSTIVKNAVALADALERRGLRLAYGGTETHLLLIDLRELKTTSGVPLNGDVAARILDLAGIVCNKNTIAGDVSANYPGGIRLGTPWISQRGLTPTDMPTLAGAIADVLLGIRTFAYFDHDDSAARGKIPGEILRSTQRTISDLIARRTVGPSEPVGWPERYSPKLIEIDGRQVLAVSGRRARAFLSDACTADIWSLQPGEVTNAEVLDGNAGQIAQATIVRLEPNQYGFDQFLVAVDSDRRADLEWWFRALSTGLVLFDDVDPWAKIDGPVAVSAATSVLSASQQETFRDAFRRPNTSPDLTKPYFVGQRALAANHASAPARLAFALAAPTGPGIASRIQATVDSVAKAAPNGWAMPTTFGDDVAEVKVLREGAGLIDETALGVIEVTGPDARSYLDLMTTNDVAFLGVSNAQYTFLLDPNGNVVADAVLYRPGSDRFLLTTSPAWTERATQWLLAAKSGRYLIDREVPQRSLPNRVAVRNLRGDTDRDARVVLGVAGPNALAALRLLAEGSGDRRTLGRIRKFNLASVRLSGLSTEVARTGHSGGTNGYEIFVHPDHANALWCDILAKGTDLGVRAVGWNAWRAVGLTAGLLVDGFGTGDLSDVSPIEASGGGQVKAHKPFFVGRRAVVEKQYPPAREIVRFRFESRDGRSLSPGARIADNNGTAIGTVIEVASLSTEPIGLGLVDRSAATVGTRLQVADPQSPDVLLALEVLSRSPRNAERVGRA